jgi:hypothetical protein
MGYSAARSAGDIHVSAGRGATCALQPTPGPRPPASRPPHPPAPPAPLQALEEATWDRLSIHSGTSSSDSPNTHVLFSQRSIGTTARQDLQRMAALASMAGGWSRSSPARRPPPPPARPLAAAPGWLTPAAAPRPQAWAPPRAGTPPARPGARRAT